MIGVDLGKLDPLNHPDVLKTMFEKNVFAVCPGFVRDAATIVNELLNDVRARNLP